MIEILVLKLSQLEPKKQDRVDWNSPTARADIEKLKRSISATLPDGSMYGIRERILVGPANSNGKYPIIKGETRWRSGTEINPEMETECEVRRYDDKVIEHLDQVSENTLRRPLNIFERAQSIKTDKDNGLSTDQIIAIHGLSNKTVVSKYLSVLRLDKAKLRIVKESYIGDLNLIGKLAKIPDQDVKELRQRLEGGEIAKKVIADILGRSKVRPEATEVYKVAFSRDQYSAILQLLDLDPADIDNPEEDITTLLKNKLEELSPANADELEDKENA
ncbi:ParB/RepB/Spo0J family partition protein [Scandinavium goeteborgense]|uniref:ParB family chromosome partitioning protein n=1 Tax=Scandinavium goeteborgense TaxID=1851514 RepID=A0A4R6DSJ5_SCAGO|nr:ParB N-terminal domain-containing protein [Scandinavium goeteborgense]TDN48080.1 ParB family chromosome partitioning protein [Scandinavium goeteborgense]